MSRDDAHTEAEHIVTIVGRDCQLSADDRRAIVDALAYDLRAASVSPRLARRKTGRGTMDQVADVKRPVKVSDSRR